MEETLTDLQAAAKRLEQLRNVFRSPQQQLKVQLAQRSLAEVMALLNSVVTNQVTVSAAEPTELGPNDLNFDQKQQVALVTILELIKLSNKGVLPAEFPTLVTSVKLEVMNRYRLQIGDACVASAFNSLISGGNIEPRVDEETDEPLGYVIKKRNLV